MFPVFRFSPVAVRSTIFDRVVRTGWSFLSGSRRSGSASDGTDQKRTSAAAAKRRRTADVAAQMDDRGVATSATMASDSTSPRNILNESHGSSASMPARGEGFVQGVQEKAHVMEGGAEKLEETDDGGGGGGEPSPVSCTEGERQPGQGRNLPLEPRKVQHQFFQLKEGCQLVLHRGDLTKWSVDRKTDAIVNAANQRMLGGGGVDGAIHRAAGPSLFQACKAVHEVSPGVRCPVGCARITRGFQLPASYVIHTVGPIYKSPAQSAPLLSSAYRSSIEVAEKYEIQHLAFPAISCGVFGYPYKEAADIALTACQERATSLKEVHFVLFELPAWSAWSSVAASKFKEISKEDMCGTIQE